jgi:hypothetical protein
MRVTVLVKATEDSEKVFVPATAAIGVVLIGRGWRSASHDIPS